MLSLLLCRPGTHDPAGELVARVEGASGVNQGLTTPATLVLEPGMSYVLTYSVAPTVVRRTV